MFWGLVLKSRSEGEMIIREAKGWKVRYLLRERHSWESPSFHSGWVWLWRALLRAQHGCYETQILSSSWEACFVLSCVGVFWWDFLGLVVVLFCLVSRELHVCQCPKKGRGNSNLSERKHSQWQPWWKWICTPTQPQNCHRFTNINSVFFRQMFSTYSQEYSHS